MIVVKRPGSASASVLCACCLAACAPPPPASPCSSVGVAATTQLVVDGMTLPKGGSDFAFDLNGDEQPDNQFAASVAILSETGHKTQGVVDASVSRGAVLMLLEISSSGECAVDSYQAMPTPSAPRFDGSDVLAIDRTFASGHFSGPVGAGTFVSEPPPALAQTPSTSVLRIALSDDGPILALPLIGAYLQLTRVADGWNGFIAGAIRNTDVDTVLRPELRRLVRRAFGALPGTPVSSCMFFCASDDGGDFDQACANGCQNADGTCAAARDGVISSCETADAWVRAVTEPDVQMFRDGRYAPNPANQDKDSLSLAVAFTAVRARW